MYSVLLFIHSWLRWFVLIGLFSCVIVGINGLISSKNFTNPIKKLVVISVAIVHTQFFMGLILYFLSPVTIFFTTHFSEAIRMQENRFFGIEHSIMMVVSVAIVTIGARLSKKQINDKDKFKIIAIWFTTALIIILISIPWSFSPIAPHRPLFRF